MNIYSQCVCEYIWKSKDDLSCLSTYVLQTEPGSASTPYPLIWAIHVEHSCRMALYIQNANHANIWTSSNWDVTIQFLPLRAQGICKKDGGKSIRSKGDRGWRETVPLKKLTEGNRNTENNKQRPAQVCSRSSWQLKLSYEDSLSPFLLLTIPLLDTTWNPGCLRGVMQGGEGKVKITRIRFLEFCVCFHWHREALLLGLCTYGRPTRRLNWPSLVVSILSS